MMTNRTFTASLKKVDAARAQGAYLEAMLRAFYLNTAMMRDLLRHVEKRAGEDRKPKSLYKHFFKSHKNSPELKALLSGQSVKKIKIWLDKTDKFFKALKAGAPSNTKALLDETTGIAGILSISTAKLSARVSKPRASARKRA
jgi:hypothetical protein